MRWPIALAPLSDELLSSWLVRLAAAHGLKLHTLAALTWPGLPVWNRDVDRSAPDVLFRTLAARTGVSLAAARATGLAAYEGTLVLGAFPATAGDPSPGSAGEPAANTGVDGAARWSDGGAPAGTARGGLTRWLLPVGVYHRTRRRYAMQYCPACLTADARPYFRRAWRLACVAVCPVHDVPLRDRCGACGAPVNFHRGDLGQRGRYAAAPLTACWTCGRDLREAVASEAAPVTAAERSGQAALLGVLARGWARVPDGAGGRPPVYGPLYFAGIRQLLRVFATGPAAAGLRTAAARRYGVAPEAWIPGAPGAARAGSPLARREVERLDLPERRYLLALTYALLADWPDGFVAVCGEARAWSSALLRDCDDAPYWYWRVVREHRYAPGPPRTGRDEDA